MKSKALELLALTEAVKPEESKFTLVNPYVDNSIINADKKIRKGRRKAKSPRAEKKRKAANRRKRKARKINRN